MHEYQPIEQTEVFTLFEECAEKCWVEVARWKQFEKQTVGRQLVRAADSVGANLVEGDGRYRPDDALNFFVTARASAREAILWCKRAQSRGLFQGGVENVIFQLEEASQQLNLLIRFRRRNASSIKTREIPSLYLSEQHPAELSGGAQSCEGDLESSNPRIL